jgi:hypothetical protein
MRTFEHKQTNKRYRSSGKDPSAVTFLFIAMRTSNFISDLAVTFHLWVYRQILPVYHSYFVCIHTFTSKQYNLVYVQDMSHFCLCRYLLNCSLEAILICACLLSVLYSVLQETVYRDKVLKSSYRLRLDETAVIMAILERNWSYSHYKINHIN